MHRTHSENNLFSSLQKNATQKTIALYSIQIGLMSAMIALYNIDHCKTGSSLFFYVGIPLALASFSTPFFAKTCKRIIYRFAFSVFNGAIMCGMWIGAFATGPSFMNCYHF
ncbi:hypothetical protein [Ralstonia solanacearum]|uniref:hypothetical protein n=1 Tax=Ralstonia solanacearum TaxID=305 RepID=UPI0012D2F089|nr:hypothetical protein [Ralstonia solanacearum]